MSLKEESDLTCQWKSCGKEFEDMSSFVKHIETLHVGMKKPEYKCLWDNCPRYNIVQISRFSLIVHLRSHTGEKPFVCSFNDCGKAFTRTETMNKHMKTMHNIDNPPSNRTKEVLRSQQSAKNNEFKKENSKKCRRRSSIKLENYELKYNACKLKYRFLKNEYEHYKIILTGKQQKIKEIQKEKAILLSLLNEIKFKN